MSKVFTITEGLENMGAIRTGGQGSVYKGRRVGEIITAIKLLPTPIFSQTDEDKHYRDFTNEVKKLQRVNEEPNPNVVKILSYGVSETGGFPFIEMEYIDGPDLAELLKEPNEPVFTVKEAIKVAEHLSHALAHCHRLDVKHGDIKSNNVKYNKHTGNYVLLDFGLAILSSEERRTSLRRAGAIEFMAPEQNEGEMFFETDVYSFGIILYELLAGKVPFPLDGNSETARNKVMVAHMEAPLPDLLSIRASLLPTDWPAAKKALEMQVPDWLIKLITKCLEKKPGNRFRNGAELHDYISHHRIFTAEIAGLVKQEDDKWQSVIAGKDNALQELEQVVASKERELQTLRQKTTQRRPATVPAKNGSVSRAAFNALLLALLLVAGLAVYGLFFNRPVVNAATAREQAGADKQTVEGNKEDNNRVVSENSSAAKKPAPAEEKRPGPKDKIEKATTTGREKTNTGEATSQTKNKSTTGSEKTSPEKSESNTADGATAVRYTVRNRAYFHNQPDGSTRREAFIIHWNKAVLTPQAEKNGFIYVVFTNHLGQVSKGWLSKDDLVEVN